MIKGFEKPKPELEQYITPSNIAAELLWTAHMDGNITGKIVLDLGCGTGIFSFGAALLGAKAVIGYDIDEKALEIAEENRKKISKTGIDMIHITFIKKDISEIDQKCDTVIMNPPFGVQRENADRIFLSKAFEISKTIYSIHKIESKLFLEKFARDNGFKSILIKEDEIPLGATMSFHKKRKYPIKVGLWKFIPENI